MTEFFDRFFIRIYKTNKKHKPVGMAALTGIVLLSLFQSLIIIALLFLFFEFTDGKSSAFLLPAFGVLLGLALFYNCVRIYKMIGLQQLLERYCCPLSDE